MDEIDTVIEDVKWGKFNLKVIDEQRVFQKGNVKRNGKSIKFENVPIIAPNGEVIIEDVSFELE